jgi:hypothetical protein
MKCRVLKSLYLVITISSCITSEGPKGFSERAISVASLDMFSQQERAAGRKSWSGDWQFRRDRLELIDASLRDVRPDVVVLQNAMRRAGSVSESDELILSSGALNRYDWRSVVVERVRESGEDRLLAVAVSKPYRHLPIPEGVKNYSEFGVDGHLAFYPIDADGEPIIIFNVQMPSKMEQSGLWYSLLEDKIRESVRLLGSCLERVVVAGYLPFEQDSRRFKDFLTGLGLKDTGTGFCQDAERCQTASPKNAIFVATQGDVTPSQLDRVMTNKFAYVYSAGASFTRTMETNDYKETYGLSRVWASQRYGWFTRARLPICPD